MTSDSTYLSMTELARRLELPESTMRYYCKRFAEFLPYKGEGRRRRYARECEKTLVFIASAMHRSKNAAAVELMLQSGRHTTLAAAPPVAQNSELAPETGRLLLDALERQAAALGKIAAALDAFTARLESGAAPAGQPAGHGALRDEVEQLKGQMFAAEKLHQEDLEQLRKWIGRIGAAVGRSG